MLFEGSYSPGSFNKNIMEKKPPGENDEQHNHVGSDSLTMAPTQSVEIMHEPHGYYPQMSENASQPNSNATWAGQPSYEEQHQQLSQYYDQRGAMYPTQMHHPVYPSHHQMHPSAVGYPHPATGVMTVPSMMPMGPTYYGHAQSCPPSNMVYGSLDSRGSITSYNSSDSFGSSGNRRQHHNGGGRRQGRRNSRHGGSSPPNRGWYRFDENTTLYQMKGRIVEISKDRDGSKFIQRRLRVADVSEMQIAFDEAMQNIEELWDDVYGNYILQGMLEFGMEGMKDTIAKRIIDGDLVSLATKVYGCRLLQKALDTLNREDVANIVISVKGKVWLLVHHHNGNHVIQKCVTKITEFVEEEREKEDSTIKALLLRSLDIIIEEVAENIQDLSVHPYGCRVVQRLIENCRGDHLEQVLDSISLHGLYSILINHEYGNYVIQRVLVYGRPSDKQAVFETITTNNNILKLSKQKHSSNVVEMMLTYGNAEQHTQFIEEMLNCVCVDEDYASKSAVIYMAEDCFANYVLKTALDVIGEGTQRERLFGILLSSLKELEKSPFAKQIVLRVKAYAEDDANCE